MYYIRQKNDILVVAMQKISLATIFIRELNDFIFISDFEYEPNRTLLSYEKITIRFCCFCSTATVPYNTIYWDEVKRKFCSHQPWRWCTPTPCDNSKQQKRFDFLFSWHPEDNRLPFYIMITISWDKLKWKFCSHKP